MAEEFYPIFLEPEYREYIRKLQDSDPASASTVFNPLFEQIIENIAAVKVTADQANGTAAAMRGWSNFNLLINSDFRNAVNRNGKTEYIGSECTIDRWLSGNEKTRIAVAEGYVKLETRLAGTGRSIRQTYENPAALYGKTITFSLLAKNIESTEGLYIAIFMSPFRNGTAELIASSDNVYSGNCKLLTCTATIPNAEDVGANKKIITYIGYKNNVAALTVNTADLIAAKLDLGSTQTLARQDEDGEWEIIDPPDYDLQYLLCSLYSPITDEWVGAQHSNENLLDNWYFIGGGSQLGSGRFPINQRMQAEYSALGYTIDRYLLDISPSSGKLLLLDDCVRIAKLNTSYDYVSMSQTLSPEINNAIKGKTATFSALVRGTGRHWIAFYDSATNITLAYKIIESSPDWTLISLSTTFPSDSLNILCMIYADNDTSATGYTDVKAAKLELGPVQTLAHKDAAGDWVLNDPPPNYALELVKCQWYQRGYYRADNDWTLFMGICGNSSYVIFPIPFLMRACPANLDISIIKLRDMNESTLRTITKAQFYGPGSTSLLLLVWASGLIPGHTHILTVNKGKTLIIDSNL